MRQGRPRSLKIKKSYKRKRYSAAKRGARNPKQLAATMGTRKKRLARRKRRK